MMDFKNKICSFIILTRLGLSLTCWGGGGGSEEEIIKKKLPGMLDANNAKHWGGWNPPPGSDIAWEEWVKNFYSEQGKKGGYKDPNSPGKPYGHDIPGFPRDWAGLGEPFTGHRPPPWAYVPRNTGKPRFCYDPPLYGNCTENLERFGFNPFLNKCQMFLYSGCGGNRNRFLDQLFCEQGCLHPPVSGCKPDSEIPIDDIDGS